MQMKRATNYALRIMIELSLSPKVAVPTLSKMLELQESYVIKILIKLKKAGLVKAIAGVNGGYSLNKERSQITLYMIIEAIENSIKINRCLEHDQFCSRSATDYCAVRKLYMELQHGIENEFKQVTLERLLLEKSSS